MTTLTEVLRRRDLAVPPGVQRLLGSVLLAVLGMLLATVLDHAGGWQLGSTTWYFTAASALLAVGLYGSTSGIDLAEVRGNVRVVLLAVTVGVLAKGALIAGVLLITVDRSPLALVLGIAMAQIDPLSFAAGRATSRMSPSAKTILSMWSSFDDPVTTLLTIYTSAFALSRMYGPAAGPGGGELLSYGAGLLGNVALAGAAALGWLAYRALTPHCRTRLRRGALEAAAVLLLAVAAVAAVHWFLMLGLAVAGLYLRPPAVTRLLPRLTGAAYLVAAVALGMLLHGGAGAVTSTLGSGWAAAIGYGLVLGTAAYLAQFVVGWVITRGRPPAERGYIARSQQNGITAIILALLLQPLFPGAVAIIAPAILVVNTLHAVVNAHWEAHLPAEPVAAPEAAEPQVAQPSGPPTICTSELRTRAARVSNSNVALAGGSRNTGSVS